MQISSQQYQRNEDVVTRRVAGEAVIVPVRQATGDLESIFTCNEVGSLLWEQLASGATVADLVTALRAEYDVDEQQARADVEEFIAELVNAGLVRPQEQEA